MTPAAIIQESAADGVNLALSPEGTIKATGAQGAVDRWLPIIRKNKPGIIAALESPTLPPLTPAERDRLIALATVWQMDAEEIQIMFRQCDYGGEGAGRRFTAAGARAFWFGQADQHVR